MSVLPLNGLIINQRAMHALAKSEARSFQRTIARRVVPLLGVLNDEVVHRVQAQHRLAAEGRRVGAGRQLVEVDLGHQGSVGSGSVGNETGI